MSKSLVLITGANRGIGLELSRRLLSEGSAVLVSARDGEKLQATCDHLRKQLARPGFEPQLYPLQLDVSSSQSIAQAVETIKIKFPGRISVLVNNAAINGPGWRQELFDKMINTNLRGQLDLALGIAPFMAQHARVVNVSSEYGKLEHLSGAYQKLVSSASSLEELTRVGWIADDPIKFKGVPCYKVSKALLNRATQILAEGRPSQPGSPEHGLQRYGVRVCAVCPGWTRTDMGGKAATRSVEQGANSIHMQVVGPPGNGTFTQDGKPLPW